MSISKPGADDGLSGVLQWSGFSFNIPQDATITGIKVDLEGYEACSCAQCTGYCHSDPLSGYTCTDPCTIPMDQAKTIQAIFVGDYALKVTAHKK